MATRQTMARVMGRVMKVHFRSDDTRSEFFAVMEILAILMVAVFVKFDAAMPHLHLGH
jgi:hypothetical protein